jgi:hypothetical protein
MAEKQENHEVENVTSGASVHSHDGSNRKDGAEDIMRAQELASAWREGTQAEKDLVRKLDWRILPCCWVLYLLGFLDRANIG